MRLRSEAEMKLKSNRGQIEVEWNWPRKVIEVSSEGSRDEFEVSSTNTKPLPNCPQTFLNMISNWAQTDPKLSPSWAELKQIWKQCRSNWAHPRPNAPKLIHGHCCCMCQGLCASAQCVCHMDMTHLDFTDTMFMVRSPVHIIYGTFQKSWKCFCFERCPWVGAPAVVDVCCHLHLGRPSGRLGGPAVGDMCCHLYF